MQRIVKNGGGKGKAGAYASLRAGAALVADRPQA